MRKWIAEKLSVLGRGDVLQDLHIYGGLLLVAIALGQRHWSVGLGFLGAALFLVGRFPGR